MDHEEKIDKEKKKILGCPDFNLKQIFIIFDQNNLGFTSESDFLIGLNSYFGIKTNKEEIILLFKHYSHPYNKRLDYSQLLRLFLPYLETGLNKEYNEFHSDTIKKLKNLLEIHLKHEIFFEQQRQL